MFLKDAVFEPSSASRHMVELSHADTSPKSSPINLIYTDGGGDHRTPFISVQISYICRWIEQDLDMLVAPRTPPYLSVLNPIERIHSTLNFGLTGMTLARKQLDDDTERKIKSLSSKKEWRKHNEEFLKGNENKVDCRKVIENTTKDCHEMIKKKFQALQYKGERIKIGEKSKQADVEQFLNHMNVIDKKINWTAKNLTKKKVMQSQDVKNFYEGHVVATQYCFQIRKCYNKKCPYHKPIQMNLGEFKKIP